MHDSTDKSLQAAHADMPLTEAQSGLWYAQRLDPDNPVFNVAHAVEIRGVLDLDAFAQAVATAIAETDALALVITASADGPRQRIDADRRPRLQQVDLRERDNPLDAARAAMRADRLTALDPARDRLAAMHLYTLAADHHLWYVRVHHLAIDGYGMTLFTDRVGALYSAILRDRNPGKTLAPLEAVLAEDDAYRRSEQRTVDAAFWRETFSPPPTVVGMASGRAVSGHDVHRVDTSVDAATTQRLQHMAKQHRLAWPDVLTTLVTLYVQRMTGRADAVVGVPHMGRFGSASARVPTMVMNVLPLPVQLDERQPLAALCAQVSTAMAGARRHGRYRSEQLRRDLGLLGGERRLYGPLVNVLPFDRPPRFADADTRVEVLATGPVDDLTITFRGQPGSGLTLEIEANPDLYAETDAQAHATRLAAFLEAALSAESLATVATASPVERQHLIHDVNATAHPVAGVTLTALIEASMARTPQAEAVVFDGQRLTYAELDARSAALAKHLLEQGIGSDAIVAVAMHRSVELIVALLAVLRAGAAYLPLDPEHPAERLRHLLQRAQARLALVDDADVARVRGTTALPVSQWPTRDTSPPRVDIPVDAAAYVIFTSGSTGEPKGVVVEHRAIVNRLQWMRSHYGLRADDRIAHKTPITFDVSVWELFLPLITGATLVVARPDEHRDPRALARLVRTHGITTMHFVPSMLAAFLAEPEVTGLHLGRVFSSGEALSADLRRRFHACVDGQLHNLYGPTEAAVDVSHWNAHATDDSDPLPIGFPVWNTRLYILDDHDRPVPAGVTGHLLIGGAQLARGYLGQDGLTAERFVPDPFMPGARMYRSGDLACRRADGAIVYLGRSDHQIKIRGVRIEPGEIESVLATAPTVRQARVVAREDRAGDRRLVAYVVPAAGCDETHLREYLAARLPDYMRPSAFVLLGELPVTANGKLDLAALPAPHVDAGAGRRARPGTEAELAALYADVLGLDAIPGADDDFFSLGGDSLLAVQMLLRIEQQWGRAPGLGALFAHPGVAALAAILDADEATADDGLAPLLPLASGNDEHPALFLVHPAGGIAWCYRHLARALAPEHRVYGLQAPGLDPECAMPDSIDALAADYVERIRQMQPEGPYHLGGWSVGGIIAHAMAVRLRQLGHDVGLLAVLDAYPSDCWRAEPDPDAGAALRALLAIAGYDPEQHRDLDTRAAIVAFLRRGDSALGNLPARTLDGVIRVVTDTNRLVRGHHHARYDGTLVHVRAARDHANGKLTPQHWAPHVAAVDVIDLPFTHADLPGADATAQVAPALRQRLAHHPHHAEDTSCN